ncbi:MAG: hypothetical protein A3F75_05445 [Betaproteobacteria bacterium RIFCSPLOWO2_12_FULL_64_23]|nr:MAG: hypothetical protein A3F75_05445 [Betaproteobacteria bacterium RIFCSPLOWO2_12_FULL_64_23]
MVDAGEKAHALAGLLQQELRDLGPRPVDRPAVVRTRLAGPLLRHTARLRCVQARTRHLRGLAVFARVNTIGEHISGIVAPLSGSGERHVGIGAESEQLFRSLESVLEAPQLRARWRYLQIQLAAVE